MKRTTLMSATRTLKDKGSKTLNEDNSHFPMFVEDSAIEVDREDSKSEEGSGHIIDNNPAKDYLPLDQLKSLEERYTLDLAHIQTEIKKRSQKNKNIGYALQQIENHLKKIKKAYEYFTTLKNTINNKQSNPLAVVNRHLSNFKPLAEKTKNYNNNEKITWVLKHAESSLRELCKKYEAYTEIKNIIENKQLINSEDKSQISPSTLSSHSAGVVSDSNTVTNSVPKRRRTISMVEETEEVGDSNLEVGSEHESGNNPASSLPSSAAPSLTNESPLFRAVCEGNLSELEKLVNSENVNQKFDFMGVKKSSLLHIASTRDNPNNLKILECLVNNGANVYDCSQECPLIPILLAAINGCSSNFICLMQKTNNWHKDKNIEPVLEYIESHLKELNIMDQEYEDYSTIQKYINDNKSKPQNSSSASNSSSSTAVVISVSDTDADTDTEMNMECDSPSSANASATSSSRSALFSSPAITIPVQPMPYSAAKPYKSRCFCATTPVSELEKLSKLANQENVDRPLKRMYGTSSFLQLICASRYGLQKRREIAKSLVEKGANVNYVSLGYPFKPILIAAMNGNLDIFKDLMEKTDNWHKDGKIGEVLKHIENRLSNLSKNNKNYKHFLDIQKIIQAKLQNSSSASSSSSTVVVSSDSAIVDSAPMSVEDTPLSSANASTASSSGAALSASGSRSAVAMLLDYDTDTDTEINVERGSPSSASASTAFSSGVALFNKKRKSAASMTEDPNQAEHARNEMENHIEEKAHSPKQKRTIGFYANNPTVSQPIDVAPAAQSLTHQ